MLTLVRATAAGHPGGRPSGLMGAGLGRGGLGTADRRRGSARARRCGLGHLRDGHELGAALAHRGLGSIGFGVYRSGLDGAPQPPPGRALTGTAAEAFTSGLTTTAAVGAACLVVLAAVAGFVLRGVEA